MLSTFPSYFYFFVIPASLLLFDLPLFLGNIFSLFYHIYTIFTFKGTEVNYACIWCCVHMFANFFGTFVYFSLLYLYGRNWPLLCFTYLLYDVYLFGHLFPYLHVVTSIRALVLPLRYYQYQHHQYIK